MDPAVPDVPEADLGVARRPTPPFGIPAEWTGAGALRPYPAERLDELVERQAIRTPQAIAVRDESDSVTYSSLVTRARQLAGVLHTRGIGRDDRVALCVDRSAQQIVAVLGILMAGAAYVPIEPEGPADRRRFMLDDAAPRAIVTNESCREAIPLSFSDRVISLDTLARTDACVDLPRLGTTRDLAYVIYTSGSTGTPKGVLNQHDAVSNHLAWMAEAFPLLPGEPVLSKTPAVFDVSVWEWFWPLSQGASLVLTRAGGEKDPRYLLDAIESHAVTNVHFVPTLLRVFLERSDLDRCRSVRRVFCSGEALTAELRDRFFERMPGPPALVNLYGPTEAAVHVTGWICTPGDTGPVPIGRPLPNVRTYIVDENLSPVAEGVQGDLLIGGVQVARGYLSRPELTAERFIPDPFVPVNGARCYRTGDRAAWRSDGAIDFFGRSDSQVQLGGARVELGEIEAALRAHPAVGDGAVLVRETGLSRRLYAYLRRAHVGQADPSTASMRRTLSTTLPDYMIPARYVWLDAFPVTPTGKLDRRALAASEAPRPVMEQIFEAPKGSTEERLARLWCEELQIDRVGRHDQFHLLGGDSLGALRLTEAIVDEFAVELPAGELLRSPTIAALARVLDTSRTPAATTVVTLRSGGNREPLYLPPSMGGQLFYWRELVQALNPNRPVYGFSLPVNGSAHGDIRSLAAVYVDDLLKFQPNGPYHLAGYSFSAAVALEMAQQLRARGRTVGVLAMIDYGPGGNSGRIRHAAQFIENLPYWLRYDILQAGWPAVAGRARRKAGTLGQRVRTLGRQTAAQLAGRAVDEMFDRERLPEPHRRLTTDHLEAFYRYRPSIYNGRILLFWARCRPLFHSLAPDLGWERYASGLDRVVVTCNHDNILAPPHVGVVAEGIDEALNTWHT
jgi:amino acid adenylation domain-containing protein